MVTAIAEFTISEKHFAIGAGSSELPKRQTLTVMSNRTRVKKTVVFFTLVLSIKITVSTKKL
jgi:hypothetical protein